MAASWAVYRGLTLWLPVGRKMIVRWLENPCGVRIYGRTFMNIVWKR